MAAENNFYLGVDLGGTGTKFALCDAQGNILLESKIPTQSQDGHDGVLRRIGDEAARLAQQAGVKPSALGMACPGTLDIENGIVKFFANFPGHWPNVPVREILQKRLDCPIYILNDVRTATLGELDFGLGKTADTFAFLALGTGIGGGIVINKHLHLGPIGSAGELGHIIVEPHGRSCGCGVRGCVETIASWPALAGEGLRLMFSGQAPKLLEIVHGNPTEMNTEAMGRAARAGDKSILAAIERAGYYLGIALVNISVTLHPDLFVFGGGMAGLGDILFDPIRKSLRENLGMFSGDSIRIEPSAVGDKAGVLGACALAMRQGKV
ncbi:TPA: hypothetical protein DDW35_02225 [Candidatus Sumerlaeota bacterium]|nr:hypothetical protein [Candidatus Sumerlaeota bacterium]